MSDHDEVPYIVIEKGSGGLGAFLLGALVGAGAALLFAPKSGKETQEEIRAKARELRSETEDRVRDAQARLEEKLDQARQGVHERVESVKTAVESGRQAARDARVELEKKLETSKAAYRAGVDAAREAATSPAVAEVGAGSGDEGESSD